MHNNPDNFATFCHCFVLAVTKNIVLLLIGYHLNLAYTHIGKVNAFDKEKIINLRISGLCYHSPDIPLLVNSNTLQSLALPNGTHVITFYSFMEYFEIDLIMEVRETGCPGIINLCKLCANHQGR